MDASSYFAVLGLPPNASKEEAKEAYRELVKQWHPDKLAHNADLQHIAQEKLKEINLAYEFIKTYQPETHSSYADTSRAPRNSPNATDDSNRRQEASDDKYKEQKAAEDERCKQERERQKVQAEQEQARQDGIRKAEKDRRVREQNLQNKRRQSRINSLRALCVCGIIGLVIWLSSGATTHTQLAAQVPNSDTPSQASVRPMEVVNATPLETPLFNILGDLHSMIGNSRSQIHQKLGYTDGPPDEFSFARSATLDEESVGTLNITTWVTYQDNKAIQIEATTKATITYQQIEQQHPGAEITAYRYDWNGHENAKDRLDYWSKVHFYVPAEVYYYDDIKQGIAFSIAAGRNYPIRTQTVSDIIIHTPGKRLIPAMYGVQRKPIGKLPDLNFPS